MIQTYVSLSQNQDSEPGRQTSQDHTKREPIPEKRSSWLAPTLFFVNTILIIVYGCVENTEVLINIGFALLGVVLAPIFRCSCLFVEELFQFQSRYKRNILNLFKQCFSGISWKPVVAVVLIDVIPCALAKKSSFELEDVICILSGIGVGPLVAYLLKLNAQSDVDLSRLLEERGYIRLIRLRGTTTSIISKKLYQYSAEVSLIVIHQCKVEAQMNAQIEIHSPKYS
jgi:hypothetical protein